MKRFLLAVLILSLLISSQPTDAQAEDPGIASAKYLLGQAAKPQRDGSHNTLLLGLRELQDPALLPLFQGLRQSPYLSMRVHGQLGAAALSPRRQVDLAALAEIEDERELVQILSAAIDDELISPKGMATLLDWQGLTLPVRQAIALRLVASGGQVDPSPYRESIDLELTSELSPAKLLQYALGALLLAETEHPSGKAALLQLTKLEHDAADAVIGQTLDTAMRSDFTTASELAVAVADDADRDSALRLLAVQAALRLKAPTAPGVWRAMFKNETSSTRRVRLAMVALDAADQVEPALFDTLDNQGVWIGHIAQAGRAIAGDSDDWAHAFEPLIQTGQPLSVQWVVTYCQRAKPTQGPELLALVLKDYEAGPKHQQGKMIQAAIEATTVLCEQHPGWAKENLPQLLAGGEEADDLTQRQIILMGIARAHDFDPVYRDQLAALAQAIHPDQHNDFSTKALRLFIHARHGLPLTVDEWDTVSDIVQGVGQFDNAMRLQFAWLYLKHKGFAKQTITEVLN